MPQHRAKPRLPVSPRDPASLAQLDQIERALLLAMRHLRDYRQQQQQAAADQGVLGSRGLSEFVLDQLRNYPNLGFTTHELLVLAEQAGYNPPTVLTLNKRLVERRHRIGDIAYDRERRVWRWQGRPS